MDFWTLYIEIGISWNFHKIREKKFWPIFKTFLTNQGKTKTKIKKIGKMSSIFEYSTSKLDSKELFLKIWAKSFFSKFLPEKDILGQSCRKSLYTTFNYMKLILGSLKHLKNSCIFIWIPIFNLGLMSFILIVFLNKRSVTFL